jgi:hypothetical protein
MATIKYTFADGHAEDVEVTEAFAAKYAKLERSEQRRIWREEKRQQREVSLERLAELDWDAPDPVNRDPQEMYAERECPRLPLFVGLTEYQQRVAVKFFVEHKTHERIAGEENVSKQAITKLIGKIQKKVINTFA